MTKSLLAFYKEEYCSTALTIEQLCQKYSVDIEELGDISDWVKTGLPEVYQSSPDLVVQPEPSNAIIDTSLQNINADIAYFKNKLIKECLARLKVAPSMDTKELKELATTVDIVDKSIKATKEGQNINVLIQNIINKYGDDV